MKICRYFILFILSIQYTFSDCSIVYVQIGKKIPSYLEDTIVQSRLFNPDTTIYVIANERPIKKFSEKFNDENIKFISCESLNPSFEHRVFNKKFKLDKTSLKYFWKHTTERFFISMN